MEDQHSTHHFFDALINNLQKVCKSSLVYSQFVEISGYICVHIDHKKEERYVLSEILHHNGRITSHSFRAKAFALYPEKENGYVRRSDFEAEKGDGDSTLARDVVRPSASSSKSTTKETLASDVPSQRLSKSVTKETLASDVPSPISPVNTVHNSEEIINRLNMRCNVQDEGCSSVGETSVMVSERDEELTVIKTEPTEAMDNCETSDISDAEDVTCDISDKSVFKSVGNIDRVQNFLNTGINNYSSNPGTIKVMKHVIRQIKQFYFDKYGVEFDLLSTGPIHMEETLLEFFQSSMKQNGQPTSPHTLKTLQISLSKYLRAEGYPYNIVSGPQFQESSRYIKSRLSEMSTLKGATTKSRVPIDETDVETMFQLGVLGGSSADALLNTMWFLSTKYFGVRGPAEHYNLKWGDIILTLDEDGNEYIYNTTSVNKSCLVYAAPDEPGRCFVSLYKQYATRRPETAMDDSAPFYLRITRTLYGKWYMNDEMPWTAHSKIWKKMLSRASLPTNKKINTS